MARLNPGGAEILFFSKSVLHTTSTNVYQCLDRVYWHSSGWFTITKACSTCTLKYTSLTLMHKNIMSKLLKLSLVI